jgi:hypothetical protein
MARTALTPTSVVYTGVAQPNTTAAIADGHKFVNGGNVWLEVANASGGDLTLTVQTQATYLGFAVADHTVTIATGTTKLVGPFSTSVFNVGSGADEGMTYVDYSTTTSVTVRCYKLTPA